MSLLWFGEPLAETAWVRVIPAGPEVPRLTSLSDGVNLLSGSTITSRSVKLFLEELATPERLEIRMHDQPVSDLDIFCTDPVNHRFEVNFQLPAVDHSGNPSGRTARRIPLVSACPHRSSGMKMLAACCLLLAGCNRELSIPITGAFKLPSGIIEVHH